LNGNLERNSEEDSDVLLEAPTFHERNVAANDFENFTSFAMDNDFDLDYMQWIIGLDTG